MLGRGDEIGPAQRVRVARVRDVRVGQQPPDLELVIVDVFLVLPGAWHHHRGDAFPEELEDGSDPGVRDHDVCRAGFGEEILGIHERVGDAGKTFAWSRRAAR